LVKSLPRSIFCGSKGHFEKGVLDMYKRNISLMGHKRRLFCLFYTILFFCITAAVDIGAAAEAQNQDASATGQASDEIMSPLRVKPEWKMPDYYPAQGFDGMGYIHDIAIGEDRVVINDSEFRISPSTEYHTPTFEHASGALFKEGDQVGYILDSEKTITSMWLIVIKR
jgi:hypothetical protein